MAQATTNIEDERLKAVADLQSYEQRVRIAAAPETVWSFWTDAALLCSWFGVDAQAEAEPGGVFRVMMSKDGPVIRGAYLELDPYSRLVFSFGWEHVADGEAMAPGTTRVEVTLTPIGADTDLVLTHHGLPADQVDAHRAGWEKFVGIELAKAVAVTHPR
jgi:uncharacterized protein YndB with AHSA1/START domain